MAAYELSKVLNTTTLPPTTWNLYSHDSETGYSPEVIANIVFYLAIAMVTTANNLLVICAVHSNPRLLRPAYLFILSLAVADLMVGVVVLPLRVVEVMAFQWTRGLTWCEVSLCLTLFSLSASMLNLLSVTIDRYIAIAYPLEYKGLITDRRVVCVVMTTWFVSGLISFFPLVGIGKKERGVRNIRVCRFADTLKEEYMAAFFGLICALPTVVISVCYLKIYCLARRQERQIASLSVNKRVRQRSGSKTQVYFYRESKAAKTVGIVVGVFYLCWIPFLVAVLLTIFKPSVVTHVLIIAAGACIYSNSAINPIIYGCLNHEFRNAYRALVRGIFRTRDARQHSIALGETLMTKREGSVRSDTYSRHKHDNKQESEPHLEVIVTASGV